MEYKFSKQTLLFSIFFAIFGIVITILEIVFYIIFKETLYLIMLVLSFVLTFILFVVLIYAKTYKVVVNNECFMITKFAKTRKISFSDENVDKIKLVLENKNLLVVFEDKNEKKISQIPLNGLDENQMKELNEILKQNKENVKIEILEDIKYNAKQ